MKFTFKVESSLGHTVTEQTSETNFEMLQNNFDEAFKVFESWNKRELGEREYLDLYLEDYTDYENELFVLFKRHYNYKVEDL